MGGFGPPPSSTMTPPAFFVAALEKEFGDRLRIRWSPLKNEWHIEQRVARAAGGTLPLHLEENPDRRARMQDGFALLMAIQPSDVMPCRDCGFPLEVPVMKFKEITCGVCKLLGRSGKRGLGYFPLNDKLIDYLKECQDAGAKADREVAMANARAELERQSKWEEERYWALEPAAWSQIPSVGLSYRGPR